MSAHTFSDVALSEHNASLDVNHGPADQAENVPEGSLHSRNSHIQIQDSRDGSSANATAILPVKSPTICGKIQDVSGTSDLWSAAFREAVASLENDVDVAILKGRNVE